MGAHVSDIDPSKFDLIKATFEVRYEPAFTIWDRSGAIWRSIQKSYPTTKLMNGSPMQVVCSIDDRFEMNVSIDKLFVIDFLPEPDLEMLIPVAEGLFSATADQLELTDFSRLGARFFYRKRFPNKDAAAAAVLSTKQVHGPATSSSKLFNIAGEIIEPGYTLKWEGEKAGVMVQVHAATRKLEVNVPKDFQRDLKPADQEFFDATLDIDYYVKAVTPRALFKPKEWLLQANHVVRRDAKYILGGA